MVGLQSLKGVLKTTIASGAIALTLAAGMSTIPTSSADARGFGRGGFGGGGFRGGFRGGGFRGGFGPRFGFRGGFGPRFGFRGGFGPRYGWGYGRGLRFGFPVYGYYGCGPYRRFYAGCGYPYYY